MRWHEVLWELERDGWSRRPRFMEIFAVSNLKRPQMKAATSSFVERGW
jgi:hypothetical protein